MSNRITQNMLNLQLIRNLNHNMNRMDNLQNQLASGRRINKPSDDPIGIGFSMRYRGEISANDQYQKNLDAAKSWLEYTDTVLGQAGDVMQRARELAVRGANGTNPQTALDAIANEVEELYSQMVQIGNSHFNGKYVFNGQLTNVKPYTEANAKNETTDGEDIKFEIGVGVQVPVNVTGETTFGSTTDPSNAFTVLQDLITSLKTGNTPGIEAALGNIATRIDVLLEQRSGVGAKLNRIELSGQRLEDISINLQSLQSKTEDADIAEVITNLKTDENVYQSSLSVGARLIRPSLIDFLR